MSKVCREVENEHRIIGETFKKAVRECCRTPFRKAEIVESWLRALLENITDREGIFFQWEKVMICQVDGQK
jgi:hypothetical protein